MHEETDDRMKMTVATIHVLIINWKMTTSTNITPVIIFHRSSLLSSLCGINLFVTLANDLNEQQASS